MNCPHECRPPFIMEDNDNAGGEKVYIIVPVFAPAKDNFVIYFFMNTYVFFMNTKVSNINFNKTSFNEEYMNRNTNSEIFF